MVWFDKITWDGPLYIKGSQTIVSKYNSLALSLYIIIYLANSIDPDEMPRYMRHVNRQILTVCQR